MGPVDLLGVAVQYFKSLPFGGKMAKWHPVMALLFTGLAGTGIFILVTPGATNMDFATFVGADWKWIQAALGTTATASLLTQAGINFGILNGDSKLIPNTNPAASVPAKAVPTS